MAGAAAGALGLLTAAVLAAAGSGAELAVAGGFATALLVVAAARPYAGFLAMLAAAVLVEGVRPAAPTWTSRLWPYLNTEWASLVRNAIPGSDPPWILEFVTTLDLLVVAVAAGAAAQAVRERRALVRPRAAALALLYLACLFAMVAAGVARGAGGAAAVWQARGLIVLVPVYLLAPTVLLDERRLRGAVWALLAATAYKSAQVIWLFFGELGGRFGGWREIVSHEDSLFFACGAAFCAALALYGAGGRQGVAATATLPLALAALLLNGKRSGYVLFFLNLALLPLLIHGRRRAALVASGAVCAVMVGYGALFWDSGSAAAVPVQKVKSIIMPAEGTDDHTSLLFRDVENAILRDAIARGPFGIGFGHPLPGEVPPPFVDPRKAGPWYRPHNALLGIWVAAGVQGAALFLAFFAAVFLLAVHDTRTQANPYVRAIACLAASAFASGLVVSLVDMHVAVERAAIFLGAVAGMAEAAARHPATSEATRPESA